jgi:transposase
VLVVVVPKADDELDREQLLAGLRRWRTRARHLGEEKKRALEEKAAWRGKAIAHKRRVGVLERRVAELETELGTANEKIATLSKLCFGTKSEKKRTAAHLEGEKAGTAAAGQPAEPQTPPGGERRRRGQQPGSRGHGRRDYEELETEEVVYDLDETDHVCSVCGAAYEPFGEESSSEIDWRVRIVHVVHRRRKYRRTCRCDTKGVLCAPGAAKPIPKGLFSTQFLARLLHEKYVLGRPLERICATLCAEGLAVSKGSLTGALRAVSDLLAPLDVAIRDRNAQAAHLSIDETSWRVFEDLEGKANHRWWLWVFIAADTVLFHIDPTRSAKVLEHHLGVDISSGTLETVAASSSAPTSTPPTSPSQEWRGSRRCGASPTSGATSCAPATPTKSCAPGATPGWSASPSSTGPTTSCGLPSLAAPSGVRLRSDSPSPWARSTSSARRRRRTRTCTPR